ncbi:MAG: hypothetical protein HWE39_18350 [Oceanospirillaceae bacterium]|nr:hypothetical protein [Oceanospirillaceae bacterium]
MKKVVPFLNLLFVSFVSFANLQYVSVSDSNAKLKISHSGVLDDEDPTGKPLLGYTFKISIKEYQSSDEEDWVMAGEDFLKVQKKYLTPISEFKVVDSNLYMDGCYFFTLGGDGRGHYMQPLPDGGVLFGGGFEPYVNTSIVWPNGIARSYGALLVYKNIATFRDGFGQIVAYSSISENNELVSFESKEPTESYYKLKCQKKYGFEEDLAPYK